MRYRISILFSILVSIGLLAGSAIAQPMFVDVPTWFVGYEWSYTETGSYKLADGRAEITLNEDYKWRVSNATSDTYTYELAKTGTMTGMVRVSIPPISLDAEVRNGRTEGSMVVKRSDLGIVRETQIRRGSLFVFGFEVGTFQLEFTLSDTPTIKMYEFPLFDGSTYSAMITKKADYKITGTGVVEELVRRIPPGSQSIDLVLGNTVTAQGSNFQVVAAADGFDASIADVYDPSIKSYREEEWRIAITLGTITQTKTLTGTPNVPDGRAQLTIRGTNSDTQFVVAGEEVILSGRGWPANATVTIRQPDTMGAEWTAQADADGEFTILITAPDNLQDRVKSDFYVAAAGLVAQSGSAAAVATLVLVQPMGN